MLSNGRHVLYTSYPKSDDLTDARVMVQSLGGGAPRVLVQGSLMAQEVGQFLVYESGGAMLAARFDDQALLTVGRPVKVLEFGTPLPNWQFTASLGGTMAYYPSPPFRGRQLVWVDSSGNEAPLPIPPVLGVTEVTIAPNGKSAVITAGLLSHYLLVADLATGTTTRLTTDVHAHAPVFTPDGRAVVFTSNGTLMIVDANGGTTPRVLRRSAGAQTPFGWLPDRRWLVYTEVTPRPAPTSGRRTSVETPRPSCSWGAAVRIGTRQCLRTAGGWRFHPTSRADRRYSCSLWNHPAFAAASLSTAGSLPSGRATVGGCSGGRMTA